MEDIPNTNTGDKPASPADGVRGLLDAGVEIAGAAVSGAVGFLAGGPAVAAVLAGGGALATMALRRIGQEISERYLAPREKARIGGVLALSAAEVKKRLDSGASVRADGFFDAKGPGRSDADEVAENVLLKSQREAEEKKLPYMAHLLANIAFDSTVSTPMAHQLVAIAGVLTYRQLCILRLAAMKSVFPLRATDYRQHGSFPRELYQVLYECLDLYHRGLVNFGGSVAFGPTDVMPAAMTLQGIGADLHNLMNLTAVPPQDLVPIANQFV